MEKKGQEGCRGRHYAITVDRMPCMGSWQAKGGVLVERPSLPDFQGKYQIGQKTYLQDVVGKKYPGTYLVVDSGLGLGKSGGPRD